MMKTFKLSAILVMSCLSACGESIDSTYATLADAENAGAIERGWIPEFVPLNAYNIRDRHNLDTNRQTLTFFIPLRDVPKFLDAVELSDRNSDRILRAKVRDGRITIERETGRIVFER